MWSQAPFYEMTWCGGVQLGSNGLLICCSERSDSVGGETPHAIDFFGGKSAVFDELVDLLLGAADDGGGLVDG